MSSPVPTGDTRAGRQWQGNRDRLQTGSWRTRREEEGAASFRGQGSMTVGTGLGLAQTFAIRVLIRTSLEIDEKSKGISTVPSDARDYALRVDAHRAAENLPGAVGDVAPVTRPDRYPLRYCPPGAFQKRRMAPAMVPSRFVLELIDAVSGRVRILDQAARSIGLSASFWVRVCQPSTLRMVI